MTKTTVYLDPEVALSLRQLAERQGCSQAELIREALATYVRRSGRLKPKGIGRYHSGRSDVSERAEELLRRAARDRRWP
ncbi:MAG TPA: CopG family transcriptional regulator [Bryobacterales bacterium]|nr:CopG family transcriptional regulator [Bryobacterales bacterium]